MCLNQWGFFRQQKRKERENTKSYEYNYVHNTDFIFVFWVTEFIHADKELFIMADEH